MYTSKFFKSIRVKYLSSGPKENNNLVLTEEVTKNLQRFHANDFSGYVSRNAKGCIGVQRFK